MHKVLALALSLLFFGLAVAGFRTLRADRYYQTALDQIQAGEGDGVAELARASQERPDWADPVALLAQQMAFAQPEQALQQARTALRLNPYSWNGWHTLGMIEYRLGREDEAWLALEQGLLVSRGFAAHFQAANLALLVDRRPVFWQQLKQAMATAASPLDDQIAYALNLAIAQSQGDPSLVAALLPDGNLEQTARAVEFLVSRGQAQAAAIGWSRVTACPDFAAATCGRAAATVAQALLHNLESPTAAGSPAGRQQALTLWNRAVNQHWLRQGAAAPGHSTDPDFDYDWLGLGFSWASDTPVAHQVLQAPGSGSQVVFQMDGTEPEHTLLLHQALLLEPRRTYEVICQAESQSGVEMGGLSVQVRQGPDILAQAPVRLLPNRTFTRVRFQSGTAAGSVDLELRYDRVFGETLLRNPFSIARIELRPLPSGPSR